MRRRKRGGYTLIEVVVALLVFTIGGLALAGSSALVARSMEANAARETAGRLAMSRMEILRSECKAAKGGAEELGAIQLRWAVTSLSGATAILESTSYTSPTGTHTETYHATVWCSS
jgi:prepilin-type N-terminal cleavage/methylation domain-containing protein